MRRNKPSGSGGGYNNQHRKQRFGGGSGGGSHNSGGNRPRRNYGAAREKYLSQARDALASGDRVLAENYFQHADHCYRMMVEEGSFRPNHHQQQPADGQAAPAEAGQDTMPQDAIPENTSALPAFITATYSAEQAAKPVDPATVQNWEDRDA